MKQLLISAAMLLLVSAGALELSKESYGVLKDVPTYIQEWHVWWSFPYPDRQRPFSHVSSKLTQEGEPWRLHWNHKGYPLVGLYDSANPEIIRWQIRCMKAAGLDTTVVMLHPEWNVGLDYIQEENANIIRLILDIAAEEKYPVFFMDEVAFRRGSPAQKPEMMVQRFNRFLKLYGNHPGFFRIDGKPVIYFQTFGFGIAPEELEQVFAEVEKESGEVYWMIFGDVGRFGKIPQLKRMVAGSSLPRNNEFTRRWELANQNPEGIFDAARKRGKQISDMQYPKFDGTGQNWRQTGVRAYGLEGRRLEKTLLASLAAKPDFVMLSSWNDWEEGAGFEPGWDFDGYTGDPYLYCRVLAHLKGKEFVPPPPPPKESVLPTVWEKLGYGDGAGPIVDKILRSNNRGGALAVTLRDTMNEVVALEVVWEGDLYWKAPQGEKAEATGFLKQLGGALGKPEQLRNVFDFTPGWAVAARAASVGFAAPELKDFTDDFAVGAAIAFDPADPFPGFQVSVPNKHTVLRREPKGGKEETYTFNFTPNTRDNSFPAELWNGWRTAVGVNPREIDFTKGNLEFKAAEQRIGQISLLGKPRKERTLANGVVLPGSDGREKTFSFVIPDEVLATPGAHFVWLRGQDKAGNWGSPVLYAVPNYEGFDREKFKTVPVSVIKEEPGMLFGADASRIDRFLPKGALKADHDKQRGSGMRIANALASAPLAQPAAGSFRLEADAIHLKNQRLMLLYLTNEEGTQGIGLSWDSSKEEMFNGEGVVGIREFRQEKPVAWNDTGKLLKSGGSGHFALGRDLAKLVLTYDAPTRKATLSVDGKERAAATLADPLPPLTRLHLRGNESQFLTRIVVFQQ